MGVSIERNLKFNGQIDNNIKKANFKLFLFRKIRQSIDKGTAVTLFKTMLLPFVEFANVFLTGCDEERKTKIQRVNKALKIALLRGRFYDTRLLHKEARQASWEIRARLAFNKLMFKYKFID